MFKLVLEKAEVHGVAKSQALLSDFTFTFHFHALEKEMATHSTVLAWRIPGTEKPGGSHLFQNFPQFIVIHTVKGFCIVNKAEIDVFLQLSCFFHDPADVAI